MAQSDTSGVTHLRLPPKAEYLPVLRAATSAIAAAMSFDFDEIVQLRFAVSELFDMATKRRSLSDDLDLRFIAGPDRLEIQVTLPSDRLHGSLATEGQERRAMLKSPMDSVKLGAEKPVVLLVKYKSGERSVRGS